MAPEGPSDQFYLESISRWNSLFSRPLSKIRADLFHRDDDKSQQDESKERNCGTHFDSLSPFLRLFLYSFLWLCTVRVRRLFMFASSSSSLSSDFGPLIGVTLATDCINKKVLLLRGSMRRRRRIRCRCAGRNSICPALLPSSSFRRRRPLFSLRYRVQ